MEPELSERVAVALERLAASNERIVEMADEEREANYQGGPAYCPHCGTGNPRVAAPGGEAPMGDFVLVATCGNCGQLFFGLPEGWQVFRTREELEGVTSEQAR